MHSVTVHDFDALTVHWEAWDRLAWGAPQRLPTLLPAWIYAYLRYRLKPSDRWFCIFAYEGDQLLGVLPLVVSPHALLGQDRPLLRAPYDNETTPSGDILLAPDCAAYALIALLREAHKQSPKYVSIDFRRVRRTSPLWAAVQRGIPGYVPHLGRKFRYSRMDVSGGFDDYFSKLGNIRRNLRRYREKCDRKGQVTIQISSDSLAEKDFLGEFLQLESSGWKGRCGTAIANHPDQKNFYAAMLNALRKQGRVEWHTLHVQDRLVAAGWGIHCSSSLILPKIAFAKEFADCMPGHLLTEAVIRDAFSRPSVVEINHMSDADWHRSWQMGHDDYRDIYLVRRGIMPQLFKSSFVEAVSAMEYARSRVPAGIKRAYRQLRAASKGRPPYAPEPE